MNRQSVQLDPLDSPHPIPWSWVLANQAEEGKEPRICYYRSQSLLSPNGRYAAYSRIQMHVSSDWLHSTVSSVLFIENLETGDLQTITPESPFADNPFLTTLGDQGPGRVAMLIPVSWSAQGDRLLAREFESQFGTDLASDFAVVWDQATNQAFTTAPSGMTYTNAILLGWSQQHPGCALFRVGMMGDENWPTWAVDVTGGSRLALEDAPLSFGEVMNNVWAGPQPHR